MSNTNQMNAKGCFLAFCLFISLFAGVYFLMDSGSDCIRIIPDGAVRCECDFKSSAEWDKYKQDTKGAWESVVMDGDYDPCKK